MPWDLLMIRRKKVAICSALAVAMYIIAIAMSFEWLKDSWESAMVRSLLVDWRHASKGAQGDLPEKIARRLLHYKRAAAPLLVDELIAAGPFARFTPDLLELFSEMPDEALAALYARLAARGCSTAEEDVSASRGQGPDMMIGCFRLIGAICYLTMDWELFDRMIVGFYSAEGLTVSEMDETRAQIEWSLQRYVARDEYPRILHRVSAGGDLMRNPAFLNWWTRYRGDIRRGRNLKGSVNSSAATPDK